MNEDEQTDQLNVREFCGASEFSFVKTNGSRSSITWFVFIAQELVCFFVCVLSNFLEDIETSLPTSTFPHPLAVLNRMDFFEHILFVLRCSVCWFSFQPNSKELQSVDCLR